MRFFLFRLQKLLWLGDRRGSGREIPRAGNPRPTRLQRFCKRNGGSRPLCTRAGGRALFRAASMMASQWIRRRPFPMRNTGRAGEASSTRAGRRAPLCASMPFSRWIRRRLGARIAFLPVPDAENAGVRRPPFPRPGNSPCHRNAPAALAEAQEAERAGGRSAIKWKAREAGDRPVAIVRGVRMPMRMRGTRHARYLQTLLQPYSYAEYATAEYSYADILHCSLSTAEYAYAAIT